MPISRRQFVSSIATAGLAMAAAKVSNAATTQRRKGYGAAVALADLQSEPRLAEAVKRYCTQIVPVYELKWGPLRPARDAFAFESGDRLLDFAERNGLSMRGHNLVWYYGLPDWTRSIRTAAEAEKELVRHIETVVSHYRGRLTSWDVVNEPIPDWAPTPESRRDCLWSDLIGPRYIELAFRTAAAADPSVRLALNEYDIEHVGARFAMKRSALRRLAFDLLDAGAPLHAIGLQCHLRGETPIDRDGVSDFVAEMRKEGLDVYVTELDVIDQDLPAAPAERDAIVARQVAELLEAVNAPAPLGTLLTWGLSDRFTWMTQTLPRPDRVPNRPLPLDAEFQPKPFMATIERFTRAAA
jgi:endo-1,4-beta-xylanase